MELARFSNPAGLDARLGHNLLLETDASGTPTTGTPGLDGVGTVAQGFLENSNVAGGGGDSPAYHRATCV